MIPRRSLVPPAGSKQTPGSDSFVTLTSKKTSFWILRKAAEFISNHHAFRDVDSEREREQIFEEFVADLSRKEKERARLRKKDLTEKFDAILRSVGRPPSLLSPLAPLTPQIALLRPQI